MESDSDAESIEGAVEVESSNWGKEKRDYYYTDYVDKDYPSKLTAKEEKLASIEQEEALRIQRKLLSSLEDANLDTVFDCSDQEDLIDVIENQNKSIEHATITTEGEKSNKRKRVTFNDEQGSCEEDFDDDDDDDDQEQETVDGDDNKNLSEADEEKLKRRPINMAIQKNRGLTPYKKKQYRNPRVKHKMKYNKSMSKRRRQVREAQSEMHRYSGEATGIKTSTVRSIKLS